MDEVKKNDIFSNIPILSELIMQYAQTYRVTRLTGSLENESDTDHSFMLGFLACALQQYCAPELDRGKLAEYALIHDFVEVYAGDTAALGNFDKNEKDRREHAALLRLKQEYDSVFPWIGDTIEKYEAQIEPETRFIKVLDKVMPGLTHFHTQGSIFDELKIPADEIRAQKDVQREWVLQVAKDWPLLIEIYDRIHQQVFSLPYFQTNDKE